VDSATLFQVHLACTLFMVGLIWFVQVVHYPLMAQVGPPEFAEYERRHQRRTTWVVAGPMLGEAATAVALAVSEPLLLRSVPFVAALILLAVIWISTARRQMPLHAALSRGYDPAVIRRLVRSN
jgi:hypothetical protein